MMRHVLVLLTILVACVSPAAASEYIADYRSDVTVARNGDLTVSETITVNAEGMLIQRGITRDFPLTMLDGEGRIVRVGFEILSATRDGRPEPYHTETIDRGIRIYLGDADTMLPRGLHTYVLTYKADRMIRYFADHDEVYWNATGTEWQFSISKASARITFPEGIVSRVAAYTGPFGSRASNARATIEGNEAVFSTTRGLGRNEGLTVVAAVPKGIIAPPTAEQLRAWWLRDHMADVIAVVGLVVIVLYYVFFWMRVGRDPDGGTVVPRWDTPAGLSPALVNYIDNKGFNGAGWPAFSASALDLAVKGYVTFTEIGSTITVKRTEKPATDLPAGQTAILNAVGGAGKVLTISSSNGEKVQEAGKKFRQAIESEHRGKYYRSNIFYTVGGIVLSVVLVIAVMAFGDIETDVSGLIGALIFTSAFTGLLSAKLGLNFRRGAPLRKKIGAVVIGGFVGFSLLSVLAGVVTAMVEQLTANDHLPTLVSIVGIVIANVVFFFLMGAPTPLGAKLMQHIEGLRLYLTVAEKDRMNMAGAPTMSPQHFEKLLPYAVALGVEKPWNDAFRTWLATATAGAAALAYDPGWYSGYSSNSSFGDSIGDFSSSMATNIASTIPAPVSSSSSGFSTGGFSSGGGGGGGFSGGGGGGGGGGGW